MKMEPVELSNHLVHAASAHWHLLMAQSSPLSRLWSWVHSSLHNQNYPGKTLRFHRGVFPQVWCFYLPFVPPTTSLAYHCGFRQGLLESLSHSLAAPSLHDGAEEIAPFLRQHFLGDLNQRCWGKFSGLSRVAPPFCWHKWYNDIGQHWPVTYSVIPAKLSCCYDAMLPIGEKLHEKTWKEQWIKKTQVFAFVSFDNAVRFQTFPWYSSKGTRTKQ